MFKDLLRDLVESTSGGVAGVVMGMDGFAVDQYVRDESTINVETLGTEYGALFQKIRETAQLLEAGDAREVAIRAESLTTILRMLNDQYFVALAVLPTGNSAKGRYLLRVAAPKLGAALE